MSFFSIITGILLLFAGRRLFWVSVACVGFLAAYRYALVNGIPGPSWFIWVVPLGIGLIGALVALVYQKAAVVLIGFMIGGLIVTDMVSLLGVHGGNFLWLILLSGGIIGAISMLIIFDWALIVLSSLAGAFVITQSLGLSSLASNISFCALAILGMVVQTLFFLKTGKRPSTE